MQTYVSLVPPAHIESAWPSLAPLLEPAVERSNDRWTMDHLFEWALRNEKQIWIVFDDKNIIHCVAVTQNVFYPSSKMLSIEKPWVSCAPGNPPTLIPSRLVKNARGMNKAVITEMTYSLLFN